MRARSSAFCSLSGLSCAIRSCTRASHSLRPAFSSASAAACNGDSLASSRASNCSSVASAARRIARLELRRERHRARRQRPRAVRPERAHLLREFLFHLQPRRLGRGEIEIAAEQARTIDRAGEPPQPPQFARRGGRAVLGGEQFDELALQRKAQPRIGCG